MICPHCDKGRVILLTSVRACEKCGGTGKISGRVATTVANIKMLNFLGLAKSLPEVSLDDLNRLLLLPENVRVVSSVPEDGDLQLRIGLAGDGLPAECEPAADALVTILYQTMISTRGVSNRFHSFSITRVCVPDPK